MTKTPQQILETFKVVLNEAAELYEKPKSLVTELEFCAVSNRRIGQRSLMKLGGFVKLRNYVAPAKDKQDKASIDLVNKILGR